MAGDQAALLTVGRQDSSTSVEPDEATLVIPRGEADAVLAVLAGIITQARADGVLTDAPEPKEHRKKLEADK